MMSRTATQQKEAIQRFIKKWSGSHKEDEEARSFLIDLLQNIFEVQNVIDRISFEKKVRVDGNVKRIDAFIPETNALIEMKSSSVDLNHTTDYETAYKQAKLYYDNLPRYEKGRFILTSNFHTIEIYDMDHPGEEPDRILLENLEQEWDKLKILIDPSLSSREAKRIKKEEDVSIRAGELVGALYRPLLAQLGPTPSQEQEKELNVLIVRIVFCLFAEDSGLFKNDQFHDFLLDYNAANINQGLEELFRILDTPEEDRDKAYLSEVLLSFPYVNGGLFEEKIRIPRFTSEILKNIIESMSEDFNWSEISPTIFGAVFESTLNPETRRSGGMHYTSIKNIHKVIDPLFLDDLKKELEEIKAYKQPNVRVRKAKEFQDKLATLKFLDPACGSGNFLTESFLCLRKLENEAIKIQLRDSPQIPMDTGFIKVTIEQFYGIEINDFAVSVARTALYIAEAQMYEETQKIVTWNDDFLPLRSYTHIREANALRIDWTNKDSKDVRTEELNYIIGNPPFVGASIMSKRQKEDLIGVLGKIRLANSTDYCAGWYHKAGELMKDYPIKTVFVSTNSITQGEQVLPVWDKLLNQYNLIINFAYPTFIWDSEASIKAHVHCVIIGMSNKEIQDEKKKLIFVNKSVEAKNISPYLFDSPSIIVSSRSKPISSVKKMTYGNKPTDGGNFILTEDEKNEILRREPNLKKYIHRYVGAADLINNKVRYCFWLKDAAPQDLAHSPELKRRLEKIREFRSKSTAKPTQEKAKTPSKFFFESQPDTDYIMVPRVSSERRMYIPIARISQNIIASDSCSIVPSNSLYDFGVLTSSTHNAWMRTVAGRLKSDYRYSGSVVYNTFPWPTPTDKQKAKIEQTAQAILDARNLYPEASLADLYDPIAMPVELRKAHEANDKAVMAAYGFKPSMSESQVVAELMKMYQKLVENEK